MNEDLGFFQLRDHFGLRDTRIVLQEAQPANERTQQLDMDLKIAWDAGEVAAIF